MLKAISSIFFLIVFLTGYSARASEGELEAMDRAWTDIEAKIHSMGVTVRELSSDPKQRYDGYRAIISLLTDHYVNQVYADKDRPETLPLIDLTNNCAPGGDFKYSTIHIEDGASYRVWGKRGDAQIIDFQQQATWIKTEKDKREENSSSKTTYSSLSNTTFSSNNIKVDSKGNFDFIMSSKKPERGQWFKLEKGATVVLIREFFSDYKTQNESAIFHLKKIRFKDTGTTVPSADQAAERLSSVAQALKYFEFCLSLPLTTMPASEDNRMRELHFQSQGEQLNQRYLTTRFNIKPGEALIGEWVLPKQCDYWNMTLYTDFWQTLNSFNRQVTLNHAIAHADKDGVVRFVISHEDPGVANWLDVDGYSQGVFIARAKYCPGTELISTKVVPIDQVKEKLPKDTEMVTAEQRAMNLDIRRNHFLSIYRR